MAVVRIVPNIAADDPAACAAFYKDLLGLDVVMDMGWIITLKGSDPSPTQVSIASEGGQGTLVPQLSIEVDDIDDVHARAVAIGVNIPYPLTTEPWGIRRFYVRDPAGTLVNISSHTA